MSKKSKKNSSNLLLVGLVIPLAVIGIVVYVTQKDEPAKSNQSKNCTTNNGTLKKEQCSEDYVGLPISEAATRARENGLFPKTIKINGKAQGFTDEGSAPIYFEVENNIVTKAYFESDRPVN